MATNWMGEGIGRAALIAAAFILGPSLQAAPFSPEQSKALYKAGYAAAVAGDAKTAAAKFQAALDADPTNFLACFDQGGLAEDAGDAAGALSAYERTVAIAPDFAEAQVELGTVYLNSRRDFDKAIAHIRAALVTKTPYLDARFTPAHTRSQALQNLTVTYALKGMFGMAQGVARSYLADSTAERARDKDLRALLDRATHDLRKPSTRQFGDELQSMSQQLQGGNATEALAAYRAFEGTHDAGSLAAIDARDLYEGIGLAEAQAGNLDGARAAFEKSCSCASPLPYPLVQESQYNLAVALARAGRAIDAVAVLDEVLWEDFVTAKDPERTKDKGYAPMIMADDSFANLRDRPYFGGVLGKYAR